MKQAFARWQPGRENDLVTGDGPPDAKLMLIGEAPGEQETLQHRPFVGKAGKNLDHFLEISGLRRDEIYITNTVKIRPTKVGKTRRLSNRPPNREELDFFTPWLMMEIQTVQPRFIAVLGNTPLHALAGRDVMIGSVHGQMVPIKGMDRTCFALYHPASLIYNPSLREIYETDIRILSSLVRAGGVG